MPPITPGICYVIIAEYSDHSGDCVVVAVFLNEDSAKAEVARIKKCDPGKTLSITPAVVIDWDAEV